MHMLNMFKNIKIYFIHQRTISFSKGFTKKNHYGKRIKL